MRVVNVDDIKSRQKQRAKKERKSAITKQVLYLVVSISILGGAAYGAMYLLPEPRADQANSTAVQNEDGESSEIPGLQQQEGALIKLTGNEFRDLYRSVNYPNVTWFSSPPEITGNREADNRIRELAINRGFVLTGYPTTAIAPTNEELVRGTEDNLLQPLALKAWKELKTEAEKASIPLKLNSGYRSAERQRELFMERLRATGVTIEQVAAGLGDASVEETLFFTAPPGFSRHHTGYTIDLVCGDAASAFLGSVCDEWLRQEDFELAKSLGWIPSYPDDADSQGPEPEPWEYVWVGTRHLYQ